MKVRLTAVALFALAFPQAALARGKQFDWAENARLVRQTLLEAAR